MMEDVNLKLSLRCILAFTALFTEIERGFVCAAVSNCLTNQTACEPGR